MISEYRLQIYLPRAFHAKLRARARSEGKSVAQVVRESLAFHLGRAVSDQVRASYAPLDGLVGALRDDGAGVAERHDEHLGTSGRW